MGYLYDAFLEDNFDLNIDVPVLIMYGKFDKVGKVKKYSNEWAREENYKLVEIPNAGYNANVDNPKVVNEEIYNFLKNDF